MLGQGPQKMGTRQLSQPWQSSKLAYIIVVELLASQFVSPVRWIETQDLLFPGFDAFERLVELGPSPTLTGVASRTLKAAYEPVGGSVGWSCAILCHVKNMNDIYYQYKDELQQSIPYSSSSPNCHPTASCIIWPLRPSKVFLPKPSRSFLPRS